METTWNFQRDGMAAWQSAGSVFFGCAMGPMPRCINQVYCWPSVLLKGAALEWYLGPEQLRLSGA